MKVFNLSLGNYLAENVILADTFLTRMRGLIGRAALTSTEGLLITRCQSIHMFFMRFPIDAVFVDRSHCIVGLVSQIKPFSFSPIFFRAQYVVEIASGRIKETGLAIGHRLELRT